jgi:hypothetical protein
MNFDLINFISILNNWIPIMQICNTLLWLLCDLYSKSTQFEKKLICNPYRKEKETMVRFPFRSLTLAWNNLK